jgi:hypothetical protein
MDSAKKVSVTSRGACISRCGFYRYSLWREWSPGPKVMFIGLNPSKADAAIDDPTIRRCIGFASRWGYGGLLMANLFAWRSTDPRAMMAADDPIGPENNQAILDMHEQSALTVAAWGAHGAYRKRGDVVRALCARGLHYLRLTSGGQPGHPLYLPAAIDPLPWGEGASTESRSTAEVSA